MDFYFITSFINMIWQIFTILFVLYRFTSFFSMIYNFILFLGKLLKCVVYVKDQISLYISKKRGYSYLNTEEINGLNERPNNTLFSKIKNWVFRKKTSPNIPLYETRHSYVNLDISSEFVNQNNNTYTHKNYNSSQQSSRLDSDFDYHMNNMINSNYESSEFPLYKNVKSSIYPPTSSVNNSCISQSTQTIEDETVKPSNVNNSNVLLESQFLNRILHTFSYEKEMSESDNDSDSDSDSEFKRALLNSDNNI